MVVKIEKLDHQGRGIAYLDKPIFIFNALPDEEVEIKIISEHKKYMEGEVINYIKKSEKRVNPFCKYFGICGGCHLQHISYIDQLNYKENKVKEIMNKFCSDNIKINSIISGNDKFYRNKAEFKVDKDIGYYMNKSNNIVNIDECMIVDKRINDVLKKLKNKNIKKDEIMIRCGNSIMNTYDNNKDIIIKLNDYKFNVSSKSFFQVNTNLTTKLYDKILEYLNLNKNDKVLDLYCGVGSIGIYISKKCNYVYGVEINEEAIKNANKNKEINSIDNIEFKCLDAKLIDTLNYKINKVVVDPPRSGLDAYTVKYLNQNKFDKVVYVSCDPITLARDLKLLSLNYEIKEITPVDMFPNTYHVECVCILKVRQALIK